MGKTLVEMKQIVDFMRENGVLHCKHGEFEVSLHPSAIRLENEEIELEAGGPIARYTTSDYDDPMLYPDGKDPIAEQREWLKQQAEAARQ
tara:strand:- start:8063 stop:8332 length:270 start_codon:yes stop_codon:yes gene_type:complete